MNHGSNKLVRVLASSAFFGFFLTTLLSSGVALAQVGSGAMDLGMLQQKLAEIKISTADNQQKLHQYTWTETSRIAVNGDARPPKESTCSYGPDGKVQKIPVGGVVDAGSSSGRGGRFRQRIVEKKTAEMKGYMQQVGQVIALYMPPNPQKMQEAFQQKKVSLGRAEDTVNLVFKDYALPGDSMTIGFDPAAKKIRSLNVNTYLDSPQDAVTLLVEFASLPDGTNHPSRTTLDAQAKKIRVVNSNANYRKIGQY